MAVRHGYGKIAGADALVFAYDTGDTRNSYKGEPTENLISPEGLTFTQITTYPGMLHSQVVDSNSPSGYACEIEIGTLPVNNSARARFGFAANIPTSGTAYVTVYAKFEGGTAANIRPAIYSGAVWQIMVPLDGGSIYLTSEYRRFGVLATLGTSSGGPNPGFSMTYSNSGGVVGQKTRWHSPQVEVKDHATPFTAGTRSATQGLLDLTGNETIDLINAGFNNNAELDFDGSNNSFEIGTYVANQGNVGSIEVVFKADNNHRGAVVGWGDLGTGYWGAFEIGPSTSGYPDEYISYVNRNGGAGYTLTMVGRDSTAGSYRLNDGQYHHAIAVVDGVKNTIYVDGEEVGTLSYQHGSATVQEFLKQNSTTNVRVGNSTYNGGHIPFNGQIPVVKFYNRGLTAAEVKNNFNNYKGRFNL